MTKSQDYMRQLESDVLARTLWGEARGEGGPGMQAVAAVILNRRDLARAGTVTWWGTDIIGICQKPFQFSCWNKSDPNLKKLRAVNDRDLSFATALRIARRAVIDALDDPTGGATHYHVRGLLPHWARGQTPTTAIGNHVFYRLEA